MPHSGTVRVGIGGWTHDPWRGAFFPPGLPKARQLDHAATRLTAIEINATFYGRQKPESFTKWAAAVPDGFRFAVKASRYCTQRKRLAEGAESVALFLGQGLERLEDRLGPILWQLPATHAFDREDLARFLDLLPGRIGDRPARHVVEARHPSFHDAAFVTLLRDHGVAIACVDRADAPMIADATGDFAYARLERAVDSEPHGYAPAALDAWAAIARSWAAGHAPRALDPVAPHGPPLPARDVFLFFIAGAKLRNPAAAEALIARLTAS